MKKKSVKIAVMASVIFALCSFAKNSYSIKQEDIIEDEETIIIPPDQSAEASDGTTFVNEGSTDVTIRFCPGSGEACTGEVKINNNSYKYNGTKGIGRPDFVVIE